MRPQLAIRASALIAVGIGAGLAMGFAADGQTTKAAGTPALRVASTWAGRVDGKPVQVTAGALQTDPGRGFVLLEAHGQPPALFSTPEGAGSLRIVSASFGRLVLRSASGALALADTGLSGDNPSFSFLGKPLGPQHLAGIGSKGVAVPVAYGPNTGKNLSPSKRAVVLIAQVKDYGDTSWKLRGYLAGYSLPGFSSRLLELRRPLRGPDGRLYRIDPAAQRLVRTTRGDWHSTWRYRFGCTTWPGTHGASYRACPDSIVEHRANGTSVSLLRRHVFKGDRGWGLVQPSPNGKWLLLEDAMGACGIATWADFLPAHGGSLVPAFPTSDTTVALGWLPDSTALVAAPTGCEDSVPGIYRVWPSAEPQNPDPPELVLAAHAQDATLWGFGH